MSKSKPRKKAEPGSVSPPVAAASDSKLEPTATS